MCVQIEYDIYTMNRQPSDLSCQIILNISKFLQRTQLFFLLVIMWPIHTHKPDSHKENDTHIILPNGN